MGIMVSPALGQREPRYGTYVEVEVLWAKGDWSDVLPSIAETPVIQPLNKPVWKTRVHCRRSGRAQRHLSLQLQHKLHQESATNMGPVNGQCGIYFFHSALRCNRELIDMSSNGP